MAVLVSSIVPSVCRYFSKNLEYSFFNLNNFESSYYIKSKHKKGVHRKGGTVRVARSLMSLKNILEFDWTM